MGELIVDYTHQFGTFDFAGSNPRYTLTIIQGLLRDAQSRDLKRIKLIHEFSGGDSIVARIWKSVASNTWHEFVPKCSEIALYDVLLAKLCAEKYRESDGNFSAKGYVKIGSFEFRLGSTILPILTKGLPITSEYFRGIHLGSVDLHGKNVSEAIACIDGALKEAKACGLKSVEFIHGYRSGTAIRDQIWKMIESNSLPDVPKCRQDDLFEYLQRYNFDAVFVDSARCFGLNERTIRARREETKVEIGCFVFRSGSTTIPIGCHQW